MRHAARDGYSREMGQVLRYTVVGTILICGVWGGLRGCCPPVFSSAPRATVFTRLLAPRRAPLYLLPPFPSSHHRVYYPGTLAMWWGSRWLRAGPVRSLPRNRGGNQWWPREVGASERVVSPEVEVAEEGYGHRGERSSRLYRGGGCESRELDRQLIHDPDRLLCQGFRFPVRTPVHRDEAVFSIPGVSNPSLFLSLPFLFSITSFSPFPFLWSSVIFLLPTAVSV